MAQKQEIVSSMEKNAEENGYFLCPDAQLFNDLIAGLATNADRYGYGSCPCRVASGLKQYDSDIICPCEYRDADVDEFGMCYCGLFVSKEVRENPSKLGPIPERRPQEILDAALNVSKTKNSKSEKRSPATKAGKGSSDISVWRCTVCGYLCARELPPPVCPICKAKAERFERFPLR